MELSSLTLRVLLLFFPGVLCAMLLDALTVHRERTPVQFLTHAFALGMGSYLSLAASRDVLAAAARRLRLREPLDVTFFETLLNDHARISWREIVLAALFAVLLAGLIAAGLNRSVVTRAAQRLRITQKAGGLDVWNYLLNSPGANYVVVRDYTEDLVYAGWLEVFSDTSDHAELLLQGVEVFRNSTSMKLYGADRVYIARPAVSLVIEAHPREPPNGRLHAD